MRNLFQEFSSRPIRAIFGDGRPDSPEAHGKEKGWVHKTKSKMSQEGKRVSVANEGIMPSGRDMGLCLGLRW